MKNRMNIKFSQFNKEHFSKDILFFFLCFLMGVILATTYIQFYGTTQNLDSFLRGQTSWLGTFIDISKYFFIILCLGFTPFGKAVIPIIFTIIGFGVSGSVSALINLLDVRDFPSTLVYIGINTIILLPFFIAFSAMASELSSMIFHLVFGAKSAVNFNRSKPKRFIFNFFIFMILLFLLSFIANIAISSLDSFVSNTSH